MKLQVLSRGVYKVDSFGPSVCAGFSGREFDAPAQTAFLSELGIPPGSLRTVKQVHGRRVCLIENPRRDFSQEEADGLITAIPGIALGIRTADCIPVFFSDPLRHVAGLAHAGWRGLYQGVLEEMISLFRSRFRSQPASLHAVLGPAIRKCCYTVGPEFLHYFPANCESGHTIHRMDLVQEARDRLEAAGIPSSQVRDTGLCTSCENGRFFSARREKTEERILSVIALRP